MEIGIALPAISQSSEATLPSMVDGTARWTIVVQGRWRLAGAKPGIRVRQGMAASFGTGRTIAMATPDPPQPRYMVAARRGSFGTCETTTAAVAPPRPKAAGTNPKAPA